MVTRRLKVAGAYALGALFAILMIAVSVMAQTIIDMKGGRIADGIELPFGAETMYAMADTQSVTAPVIDALGIEGITDNVKAGGRFRVAVVLKDYNKSIKGAGIVLKNPDTGSMISAGGDNTALTDGKYIDVVVPEYAQGGVYVVDRVVLMDSDMKTHIYYNPDIYNSDYISDTKTALTDNQKKLSVTVVSDKKDNSAPKLYSYEIEKNSASAGEEIMFAVEAEDVLEVVKDVYNNDVVYSGSGLGSLKVNWERQQNESEKTSLLGRYSFVIETAFADLKQNNNVYYGTFRIPSSYAAGKYMIKNIEIEDKAGNKSVYVNPDVDQWNSLYGNTDNRNKLPDSVCGTYLNITDGKEKGTDIKNSQQTTASVIGIGSSVVERFELNSFGRMAAHVIVTSADESEIMGNLDDDTKTYAKQNFRFAATADSNVIGDDNKLSVNRVVNGDEYDNARRLVKNKSSKSVVFDIDILDGNEQSVQPAGLVSITADIPDGFNKDKVSVYRMSDDGKTCYRIDSTVSGDKVIFDTDHFSIFVIAQDTDGTAMVSQAPRTADEAPLAALGFVVASAMMAIVINIKKSKQIKIN